MAIETAVQHTLLEEVQQTVFCLLGALSLRIHFLTVRSLTPKYFAM